MYPIRRHAIETAKLNNYNDMILKKEYDNGHLLQKMQNIPNTNEDKQNLMIAAGHTYWAQKKYDKAEALFKEVLAATEDKKRGNNAKLIDVLLNLGAMYMDSEQLTESTKYYQRY